MRLQKKLNQVFMQLILCKSRSLLRKENSDKMQIREKFNQKKKRRLKMRIENLSSPSARLNAFAMFA